MAEPGSERVEQLLRAASELPPDEQEAFLVSQTRDPGMTALLRDLLRARNSAGATTPSPGHAPPPPPFVLPARIGPYRILDELGKGGMGVVLLARQTEPVVRDVALKLILGGAHSAHVVARFQKERQALARMSHDGIAKVFEFGTTETGQPYFVMELVKGIPLDTFCARFRLPLVQRIELIQQLCSAVQHAHHKGVMHRDLKPTNVLVGDESGEPRAKVIDFGLAKETAAGQLGDDDLTAGSIVGTAGYMAPEQADPSGLDIDTRADVYAIGVMLYEVLCGSQPYTREQMRNWYEIARTLREIDPPRPSARLATSPDAAEFAGRCSTPLPQLRAALRDDLDWVALKAIAKERSERYDTPAALAADLQRFLDGEPLSAGPPNAAYRVKKLLRRYRKQVVAIGAVLVTAVVGAVVATLFAIDAHQKERELTRWVHDFDLLSARTRRDHAIEAADLLYPADAEHVAAMQAWLDGDAARLLAMRGELAALLDTAPPANDEVRALLRREAEEVLAGLDDLTRVKADVERRIRWATEVAELPDKHPNAQFTWDDVRKDVRRRVPANPYRAQPPDLDAHATFGLVPIGRNPKTGLWECYDLRSAWDGKQHVRSLAIPQLAADGSVEVTEATGILFVLVPGVEGSSLVDGEAYTIRLTPFFVARHELTRAQWQRLTAESDFWWRPDEFTTVGEPPLTDAHPAENMTWADADRWLRRYGFALPAETQWEIACCANRETTWCCGDDPQRLREFANLRDESIPDQRRRQWGAPEPWNDHRIGIAHVGSFLPNDFGLYDVHGNVSEWCRDWYSPDRHPPRAGDGLRELPPGVTGEHRIHRGGSYRTSAAVARCVGTTLPNLANSKDAGAHIGIRPVRNLAW